ncbi:MAG: hypothetical protein RIS17_1359, partial [Pseudomonadota bacterium]
MCAATAPAPDMNLRLLPLMTLMLAGPALGQPASNPFRDLAAPTAGWVEPPPKPRIVPVNPDDPSAGERLQVQVLTPTNRYRWPTPPPMGWAELRDPAALPLQTPEIAADGAIGFTPRLPVLEEELRPTEQAQVAAILADFSLSQLAALNQFFLAQPEGDRGAFVRIILERRPAALPAVLRVLSVLDADERHAVARDIFIREIGQWIAIPDLAVAVDTQTAAAMLSFRNIPAICDNVAPAMQPQCQTARAQFVKLYGWSRKGPGMVEAKRGIAPFMAQLYRSGADAVAQNSKRKMADERRQLGQQRNEWDRLHLCGAAYLGDNWVITAAHCIDTSPQFTGARFLAERRIRMGTLDIHESGQTWGIDAVVLHGGYGSALDGNDIALIRLKGPPQGTPDERIAPVTLPFRPQPIGRTLQVTGWGVTGVATRGNDIRDIRNSLQEASRLLRVGELKLLTSTVCNTNAHFKARGYRVGSSQLCAGSTDGVDTCRGDSGGPLVLPRAGQPAVLVGLVSYGPGCGQANTPGVYTDVHRFVGWVAAAKAQARSGMIIDWRPGRCRHEG